MLRTKRGKNLFNTVAVTDYEDTEELDLEKKELVRLYRNWLASLGDVKLSNVEVHIVYPDQAKYKTLKEALRPPRDYSHLDPQRGELYFD